MVNKWSVLHTSQSQGQLIKISSLLLCKNKRIRLNLRGIGLCGVVSPQISPAMETTPIIRVLQICRRSVGDCDSR